MIHLPLSTQLTSDSSMPLALGQPKDYGGPISYSRRNSSSPYITAYSWKKGDASPIHEVDELMVQSMSKLNHAVANLPSSSKVIASTDILITKHWQHFPHFSTAAINSGALQQLQDLQGTANTFWLSSLRTFENQEQIVASAYDIVDSHFSFTSSYRSSQLLT